MATESMTPLRIALWGRGSYTSRLVGKIAEIWSDRYRLTMVFVQEQVKDLDYGVLPVVVVDDPATVGSYYEQGCFDAVLLSVYSNQTYMQMEKPLRAMGVPIVSLGSRSDFVSTSELPQFEAEPPLTIDVPGYRLSACKNVYGFVTNRAQQLAYFYDGNGHITIDNWFGDDWSYEPTMLNYLVRVDRIPDDPIRIEGDVCAVGRLWGSNYAHFTYQCFDQIAIMEKAGYQGKYMLVHASFTPKLMELAGIGEERIVWMDDLEWNRPYIFDRVYFLGEGYRHSARKAAPHCVYLAERIEKAALAEVGDVDLPSRLFVKRIGTRKLLKADEILERFGFTTIIPEELSVSEQIAYLHAADIVVSPHGANCANAVYMRPGTVIIETFGKGWVFPMTTAIFLERGIHHLPVIEEPIMYGDIPKWPCDYSVKAIDLEMAIRNAEALVRCMQVQEDETRA